MKRKLSSVLIFLSVLCYFSVAFAEEEMICFAKPQAENMLLQLEEAQKNSQIIVALEKENAEQEKIIVAKDKQIGNLDAQLERDKLKMELYKEIIKDQETLCKERVKAASPSFFEQVGKFLLGILAGIGIGLAL